jgi:hypothetical protein
MMKLCKDCSRCHTSQSPVNGEIDWTRAECMRVIVVEQEHFELSRCWAMRLPFRECGPDGKLFEAKS